VGTGAWNPETTKGNSIRLRQRCEHLPNRELTEITQWVWWERPGWAAYTKKGFFIATRAFCKWAAGKGYITYPAGLILSKGTKMQAKQKKLRAITMDQLADICAAYRWQTRMAKAHRWIPQDYDPTRHIHMWWMIFRLTLRKGEIPKVMPGDVEPGHINVIRKGGKRQRLYIYEALQPHIDWFRDHQIPGKPFFGFDSMRGPAKILHRAAKLALGPDFPGTFGFHTFRHAGITYMIENQIPIHMVSEYAGHASVSITLDAYAHVIKANEQTKMDGLD
jgi:integrase